MWIPIIALKQSDGVYRQQTMGGIFPTKEDAAKAGEPLLRQAEINAAKNSYTANAEYTLFVAELRFKAVRPAPVLEEVKEEEPKPESAK